MNFEPYLFAGEHHRDRARLSSLRIKVLDGAADGQVWIQSTLSETHRLTKREKDDFSFSCRDLAMLSNRGECPCTIRLEVIATGESGIFIGSTRRGGFAMRERESRKLKLQAGEVLTLRSLDAVEPQGRHADGSPIQIRPGQSIAIGG